ncbi:RNA polymerase sigma-70 factor (ECF subfamily) [Paucibacter oligotrophus]|uniref:RNA polymerase sigma-70 factor (ECF subfamily) n=1 Tax=Roseateles oligotrophus TaxID=1769250 RepID=A0A840LAX4_9BURK|nr:sigma-70 family RNA polymerase sigma factor [Roseateles oligotrophus]MBB4845734.1 RNA polymerase sigma-70 factor (ECF subfamily) [Roseateles oligotrophus]
MTEPSVQPQPLLQGLYREHHGWLLAWLDRRIRCAADAADLSQDVFLRLLRRPQALPLQAPRAYLATVARGLMIDHWRRRELEQAWAETLAALPEAQAPSPEQELELLQLLIEIDRVLDGLKPAVRRAFLLARLEGLSCPQIARELGISLATAERHVAAGLRRCYALRYES